MPRRLALAAAILVVPLLAVAQPQASGTPRDVPASHAGTGAPVADAPAISWTSCPAYARASGIRCGTIQVPLDHADPSGRTITLAFSRLRASNPDKRRGVLFTNPGGPGGPGLARPRELRDLLGLPRAVLDRYDIIGIDHRGLGRSTPVTCDIDTTRYSNNIPGWADNAREVRAAARKAERIAGKCGRSETADIAPYITTANIARDLDLLRAALGEDTISYYGVSYGTYLGAVYTTLFPERSDRFLLDSSTGPRGWDARFYRALARGVADRFPDFARYASRRPRLGLGSTPAAVRRTYFSIARRLERRPAPGGFDDSAFRLLTYGGLYYTAEFPLLASQWRALARGEALPGPAGRGSGESSSSAADVLENRTASNLHVLCNDNDYQDDLSSYQRHVRRDRAAYPLFGGSAANVPPCAYWPFEQQEAPVEITDDGPSNVLMVQNRRDPATPLFQARELRRAFGARARMITVNAGGHLSYLYVANRCVQVRTTRFLVSGARPAEDRVCRR